MKSALTRTFYGIVNQVEREIREQARFERGGPVEVACLMPLRHWVDNQLLTPVIWQMKNEVLEAGWRDDS